MKRNKIYLARKLQFFLGILYFPMLMLIISAIVIQTKSGESPLWLVIGLILYSIFKLPFFLIPGTATIHFYNNYITYKKNLFAKSVIVCDELITKLYVDFCNEPPQPKLREGLVLSAHRGYVFIRHEIVCIFALNYKLLREWLNRIDSSKVKVNPPLNTYISKRYYLLLESYLTEKQKREVRKK